VRNFTELFCSPEKDCSFLGSASDLGVTTNHVVVLFISVHEMKELEICFLCSFVVFLY